MTLKAQRMRLAQHSVRKDGNDADEEYCAKDVRAIVVAQVRFESDVSGCRLL